MPKRVILIVLDSVGIGALPDADHYGDAGSHTLGNIAKAVPNLRLPNLVAMGLGNIDPSANIGTTESPSGAYGKAAEASNGKDTTTGHWEIAGLLVDQGFPYYPEGFPKEIMDEFAKRIGTGWLGNHTASGTAIIEELGPRHLETGFPIVYTSSDSVFQIAMHEDIIPLERQHEICTIARDLLQGEHQVGRVIARPFIGQPGKFERTSNRRDYSVEPPEDTVLVNIEKAGLQVMGVGKIKDIFATIGISSNLKTKNNWEGVEKTIELMKQSDEGLIFTNLVDFDMLYGHRRDPDGYANCLMEFDSQLPEICTAMKEDDILILTADHGNDPTFPGTDHTREYVPVLVYGDSIQSGTDLGTLPTFSDIGATVADFLGTALPPAGHSFLSRVQKKVSI